MATRATHAAIIPAASIGDLIVKPTFTVSIAGQVAKLIDVDGASFKFPIVKSDPSASWVGEGQEIPVTDSEVEELTVYPQKLAALTIISSELREDSDPAAAEMIGEGLARDFARKIDASFFGTKGGSTVQPAGLGDLVGFSAVSVAAITDTDPFAEALSKAEGVGATVRAFVMNPTDLLTLTKVKKTTAGSNEPLLGSDPTQPGKRQVLGVPILSTSAVDAGTVWGVPTEHVYVLMRTGLGFAPDVEISGAPYFTSDRYAIRARMRVAYAFPHPAAIVKITVTGA